MLRGGFTWSDCMHRWFSPLERQQCGAAGVGEGAGAAFCLGARKERGVALV